MELARLWLVTLALACATLGVPPSLAEPPCIAQQTVTPVGGPYASSYLAQDPPTSGYDVSTWIYMESNGMEGLQRGGNALTTGTPDWCVSDASADVGPDTLLSGIALAPGQVGSAPLPGLVLISQFPGQAAPSVTNVWGHACGPLTVTPTTASVSCSAPTPVPTGFTAGCSNVLVLAGYIPAPTQPGASLSGKIGCGAASATCSAPPGTGFCAATGGNAAGALPMTCSGTRGPAIYVGWLVWCQFS